MVIGLLGLSVPSLAAGPYLAATKSTDAITRVEVEYTVGTVITVVPGIYVVRTDDPMIVNLVDLSILAVGNYNFRVRWATASSWWSDWSVPFAAAKPANPGGVGIKP